MDALTAFGLFAGATLMLVTYALEDRSPWFILAFAGRLRARLGLRLSSGRLAVRRYRGDLGRRGGMAMGEAPRMTAKPSCHIKVAQSDEIVAAERLAG